MYIKLHLKSSQIQLRPKNLNFSVRINSKNNSKACNKQK